MSDTAPARERTKWGKAVGLAIAASVGVGLLMLAFIWPTLTSTARDLPVAITGPTTQVTAVTAALTKHPESPFTVSRVSDRAAAVSGIKNRTYDGAIVLGATPEVLTASAASTVASQIMTQVQATLQKQIDHQVAAARAAAASAQIPTVTVGLTDVVPLADTDARGLGLTVASFPLAIGGMLGGIVISLLVGGIWRRLAAAAIYAVGASLTIVTIVQPWFGILQGDFGINLGAVALTLFATVAFITGMAALIGRPGVAIGAVVTLLVGNPLSGATEPVQFIVAPWGAVGQWLVPGASTTLLRDLSYFPDASNAFPILVLTGWAVLGILLTVFGHFRSREIVRIRDWGEVPDQRPTQQPVGAGLTPHAPVAESQPS